MKLAIRDLEALLAVPGPTLYRWIRTRGLPARWLGDQVRFDPVDLLDWAIASGVPLARNPWSELRKDTERRPDPIRATTVPMHLSASTEWSESLEALLEAVPEVRGARRDLVKARLQAKEGYRVMAGGIAVPRPTHPLLLVAGDPQVRFCILSGISLAAWVWILAPTPLGHCQVLAELARRGPRTVLAEAAGA